MQKLKIALSADAAADPAEVPAAATGGPATPSPQTLPTTSWTKDAGGSGVKWDFHQQQIEVLTRKIQDSYKQKRLGFNKFWISRENQDLTNRNRDFIRKIG